MLAVSVNGKVATTGWSFKDGTGKGPGYSILLPPDSLKKGVNDVEIFLVTKAGKGLQRLYPGRVKSGA